MGGLITIAAIFIPLGMVTALIEKLLTIPERIRDRRAVAFLKKRHKLNLWRY